MTVEANNFESAVEYALNQQFVFAIRDKRHLVAGEPQCLGQCQTTHQVSGAHSGSRINPDYNMAGFRWR